MKTARFIAQAQIEFLEQVTYYEQIERGLGERFRQSVMSALQLACLLPTSGTTWKHNTRRVFTKHFPFSVVYREVNEEIIIFAIAHFRRKPSHWHDRKL